MRACILALVLSVIAAHCAPTFAQQLKVDVEASTSTAEHNPVTTHRLTAMLTGVPAGKKYKWIVTKDGQEVDSSKVAQSVPAADVALAIISGADFGEYVFLALPDPIANGAISTTVRVNPPSLQVAAASVATASLQAGFQPGTDFTTWIQQNIEDRLKINRLDPKYSSTLSQLAKNIQDSLAAFRQTEGANGTTETLDARMKSAWMDAINEVEGIKGEELEALLSATPEQNRGIVRDRIIRTSPYYKWVGAYTDIRTEIAQRGLAANRDSLESAYEGIAKSIEPTRARDAAFRASVIKYIVDNNLNVTSGGDSGGGRRRRGDDACWLYYLFP